MKPRRFRLNEAQQRWVRDWWRALQPRVEGDAPLPGELWAMGRGERAQLRRCAGVEDLLAHAAPLLLAERLIALDSERGTLPDEARSYERVACLAGVLAFVKDDTRDGRSLAWHLGHGAGNERPKMSELRFKTLQRSASVADLFRQWCRALQLVGGKVDVARLADDLLSWQIELGHSAARASDGVKFHWACDYYLSTRERAAADETEFQKEISV
jgi:CRISPR system Cascade subunit CasB